MVVVVFVGVVGVVGIDIVGVFSILRLVFKNINICSKRRESNIFNL